MINEENKGQDFEEFLAEQGILEECTEKAVANNAIRTEIASQKYGIKVTAVDFNGETFDGPPLVPVGITQEVFGNLLATDQIAIKRHTSTDYALWEVQTVHGVRTAGPGDFIKVLESGELELLIDPGSDYN